MPRKKRKHTITVEGPPKPKGRPRLGRRGRVFTPTTTLEAEARIADAWDGPRFDGPLSMEVVFNPKFTTVTVEMMPDGTEPSKLRGDIDNYLKLLMDGLNGIAYEDDKQVVHIEVRKT